MRLFYFPEIDSSYTVHFYRQRLLNRTCNPLYVCAAGQPSYIVNVYYTTGQKLWSSTLNAFSEISKYSLTGGRDHLH